MSATDHLDAIRRHINAGFTFPMAHLTMCRSALIGAAQTVWVLASEDRPIRLLRYRTVTAYLYKHHLQYLNGLQDRSAAPHLGTDLVAAGSIKERKEQLAEKRKADKQRSALETTEMIRQAAEGAFPDQPELADEASSPGGAVQVPPTAFRGRYSGLAGTIQTKLAGSDGLGEFQAGGSLARMANVYMAAFHLADRGWNLLRHRGAGRI